MLNGPHHADSAAFEFESSRSVLFTIAYEMLGSASDADDVVQEVWLRWSRVDVAEVRVPRAYLVRITTRLALNRLRSLKRLREDYVGEWLPEPVATGPDVSNDVELAESVSMAMLTVLETLGPVERAVFVLREVFDLPYDEIGAAVNKSATAVRQVAHRARSHVHARRGRFEVSHAELQGTIDRFLAALRSGDVEAVVEVLAPDVVGIADGGGVVSAARRPIRGAERVAAFLLAATRALDHTLDSVTLNGAPAVQVYVSGHRHAVLHLQIRDGRVAVIHAIANPEKLQHLDEVTTLSRR